MRGNFRILPFFSSLTTARLSKLFAIQYFRKKTRSSRKCMFILRLATNATYKKVYAKIYFSQKIAYVIDIVWTERMK